MTTKTPAQLDKEIRAAIKLGHGDITTAHSDRCNTCGRPSSAPFRRFDKSGKLTEGCIDAAHTGHVYGESLRWHNRPEAKKMRKDAVERLRGLLTGHRA